MKIHPETTELNRKQRDVLKWLHGDNDVPFISPKGIKQLIHFGYAIEKHGKIFLTDKGQNVDKRKL